MYFLTNKENIIIAASDTLLQYLEGRDICSLTNAFKNETFQLNKEQKTLSIESNEIFTYEYATLHSLLGELELYTLKELQSAQEVSEQERNEEEALLSIKEPKEKETVEPTPPPLKEPEEEIMKVPPSEVTLLDTKDLELTNNEISELEVQELKIPQIPTEALDIEENLKIEKEPKEEDTIQESISLKLETQETQDKETPKESISLELETQNKEPQQQEQTLKIQEEPTVQESIKEQEAPAPEYIKLEEALYNEPIGDISKLIEEETQSSKKSLFPKKIFSWGKKKKEQEEEPTLKEEQKEDIALEETQTKKEIKPKAQEEDKFLELEQALLADEKEEIQSNKTKEVAKPQEPQKVTTIKEAPSINLKANAQKLNVNIESYIMLIESYIDEIKSHLDELKNGNQDIKNMLVDAGEFLSLQIITKHLRELSQEHNNHSIMQNLQNSLKSIEEEIHPTTQPQEKVVQPQKESSLTLEEIEPKEEKPIIQQQPKESSIVIDEIQETKATPSYEIKEEPQKAQESIIEEKQAEAVAEDAIELSDSSSLLQKIEPQAITIDIEETAEALNLPKDLIYEFIKDFLEQMKEHLDIFIQAYSSKDLEKIYTTAHMLKGAANNLRLNAIGDTLLKLQKEENLDTIALLIKKFAAQTKGLENELAKIGE